MTKKIQLLFGLLAFAAVISVFSWFDYFNKGLAASFNLDSWTSKLSLKTDTDPDKDGLSNIDESYWNTDFQNPDTDGDGFLDGEEVVSGHDPSKAGPDDSLRDLNLTQKLSELTSAGLVEGSLKMDSSNLDKSLANLVDYTTDNATFSINGIVSENRLKIVDATRESQDKYLSDTYGIIKRFLVAYGDQLSNSSQYLDIIGVYGFAEPNVAFYFSGQEKVFTKIFDDAIKINVPKNWRDDHLRLVGEIKIAAESNRAISLGKNDPVKAAVAFEYFFGVIDRIPEWSWGYINKNRSENINNPLIESLSK